MEKCNTNIATCGHRSLLLPTDRPSILWTSITDSTIFSVGCPVETGQKDQALQAPASLAPSVAHSDQSEADLLDVKGDSVIRLASAEKEAMGNSPFDLSHKMEHAKLNAGDTEALMATQTLRLSDAGMNSVPDRKRKL